MTTTIRFWHAMRATVYTLVIAPTLGFNAAASVALDNCINFIRNVACHPVTPVAQSSTDTFTTTTSMSMAVQLNFVNSPQTSSRIAEEQTPPSTLSVSGGQKTSIASGSVQDHGHAHRPSTTSLALSLKDPIESSGTHLIFRAPAPACSNDYSHAAAIVSSAVQRAPAKAILTSVTILLTPDKSEGIRVMIASVIESSKPQELPPRPSGLCPVDCPPTISGVRDNFSPLAERPNQFPSGDSPAPGLLRDLCPRFLWEPSRNDS